MRNRPEVLAIGSVLWDIIGRSPVPMQAGADMPGRIKRLPGGVAMNIAMALNRFGIQTAVLSALGQDAEGKDLLHRARALGLNMDYVYLSDDLPTDRYMAIETADGLIAAIADAHSLEAAGSKILTPLADGRLADAGNPWAGMVALDGNLTRDMLAEIAQGAMFDRADLRIAPASPGKAARLQAFIGHRHATLYLNLEEAQLLSGHAAAEAPGAAAALIDQGCLRVLVTDGARKAAYATPNAVIAEAPPKVAVRRITGAGDMFMAAHMAAELRGQDGPAALTSALKAAASYVASEAAI